MTTLNRQELTSLTGRTVYDSSGDKIGKLGELWTDENSGQPTWVTVHTGLFGMNETFLPVEGLRSSGDDVTTPHTKEQVKDAPNFDPSSGHIDRDEETRLYRHYGLTGGGTDTVGERSATTGRAATGRTGRTDTDLTDTDLTSADRTSAGHRAAVGHDTSGPNTDDAMTRSEERLKVGTEEREAGRARLRKYVVTSTEQVEVPVSREEVRVEREPITDANRGAALDGPAISEEEHEVTLHEERPVVETEAVPVERVRLSKERVTGNETVSGEVREERIDTDVQGDARGRRPGV
ncbi:DUF2382 domain-containing protein [Umezawaea beigongshangensis]|uniref:DUF2382 domain-containing protein n=1 Tax=Umezawaea beigongshangensis TaxID=2780383 RepID=UPI0018F1203E|nr:PRC and DUF2382 domain-containing protein [Umezawaea beigongshangensis]